VAEDPGAPPAPARGMGDAPPAPRPESHKTAGIPHVFIRTTCARRRPHDGKWTAYPRLDSDRGPRAAGSPQRAREHEERLDWVDAPTSPSIVARAACARRQRSRPPTSACGADDLPDLIAVSCADEVELLVGATRPG